MDLGTIGLALALCLSCAGAAIGCGIAGMAAHGVMSRTEEGRGKFLGMSAIPSSQMIYGIVLMFRMQDSLKAGTVTPEAAFGIGLTVGLTILVSAVYQGMCAATGIQASSRDPALFGISLATLGIIESFALFALVFSLVLM